MTNFNSSLLAGANASEILKLARSVDRSEMTADQIAELEDAIAGLEAKIAQEKDYEKGSKRSFKDSAKSKNATKKAAKQQKNIREAKVGCGNLVDAAFVPGSEDNQKLSLDDDNKVLQICEISKGTPADGKHWVRLAEYPQKHTGRNGNDDYRILRIVDKEAKIEWTKVVSEKDLTAMFSDINSENHGMLTSGGQATIREYFETLMKFDFSCWTVVNPYEKTCTYFRLEGKGGYKAYLWFIQNQEANRQDKEQAYRDAKAANAQKTFASNGNRKVTRKNSK